MASAACAARASTAAESLDALKISEDKKRYILDRLNPTLEELVADCIHQMPLDPVPFMWEWLKNRKVREDDHLLAPVDRSRLLEENSRLEADITRVKAQVQECAKMAAGGESDESEDSGDDDIEPPPDFEQNMNKKARASVSAEAYGEWNKRATFVPPVVGKTDEQKDRLRSVLGKSFLFSNLDETDFAIIIGAMREVSIQPQACVITQGDPGDFLFVIESGDFECVVTTPEGMQKVVKTCGAGDVFGELALLYNCPRAASVRSKADSVCWELDRDTFNNIVKEAAQRKRDRYDQFLAKVPILESMDMYERSQLADAVRIEIFSDGHHITEQGEIGHKFYIIEEGAAHALKNGVQVMEYGIGDYFGELALITNQARAATVVCRGACRCLTVDKHSFHRLLNVSHLLERSNQYR